MKGIVIDVYGAEAFISMEDGTNICVGIAHLPSKVNTGSTVNIGSNSTQMVNHNVNQLIL
jgi:hypothetical protein